MATAIPVVASGAPSSDELLSQLQHGDRTASAEIFGRFYNRLFRLAARRQSRDLRRRFGGEDVAQSALRTFFTHARAGEYSLEPGGDLWHLLRTIALRKLTAHSRKHKAKKRSVSREQRESDDVHGEIRDSNAVRPDEQAAVCDELNHVLLALRAEYRQMILLRLAGYSVDDIAREVGCCERTVFRAFERFGELVSGRQRALAEES
jgi:RNA polymerase sigma factor (sigma-70 family)